MALIRIENTYDCDAHRLWIINSDWRYFARILKNICEFKYLPEAKFKNGECLNIEVRLLKQRKFSPWQINITEIDNERMFFRSLEHGKGIKKWAHYSKVEAFGDKAKLIDEIEIDAGLLTPLYAIFVRQYYKKRYLPRVELLKVINDQG